jgi:hypothetical protein
MIQNRKLDGPVFPDLPNLVINRSEDSFCYQDLKDPKALRVLALTLVLVATFTVRSGVWYIDRDGLSTIQVG